MFLNVAGVNLEAKALHGGKSSKGARKAPKFSDR